MKPYGRNKKLARNFEDVHPPKGYQNWWEDISNFCKKRDRRNSKKQVEEELENLPDQDSVSPSDLQ